MCVFKYTFLNKRKEIKRKEKKSKAIWAAVVEPVGLKANWSLIWAAISGSSTAG